MVKSRFDDSGFRELERRLKKLEGTKRVPVDDYFPEAFVKKYTPYATLGEMLQSAGIDTDSLADLEGLEHNDEWNAFVNEKTEFGNWAEMVQAAGVEYAKRKLGL